MNNLSDRINAVYRTHTGATRDRGARTWFARTLRVDVRSVTRWCDGSQTFDGPAAACLTLLELIAGHIRGHMAMDASYKADTLLDHSALADSLRVLRKPKQSRTKN